MDAEQRSPGIPDIFFSFLKLGATAFGGPAMVAHIRRMAVERKHWLDEDTFRGGVALCQTIPGATAMQSCAYVGLRLKGVRGAAAAFSGFALPAFLLITALSALYIRFRELPLMVSAFGGLRVLIVAIIANAAISFGRTYLKRWQDIALALVAGALFWLGISPMLVVPLSALLGILLHWKVHATAGGLAPARLSFPLRGILIILGAAAIGLVILFVFDRRLLELSFLMLKVDLFAFGGGFASVPLMLNEVVNNRGWMDQQTFMDGIALGQVTPGPVVITATFVGYILKGLIGGVVATASIFLPSFILVISTAPFLAKFNSSPLFRRAVDGILCSFVGLLACTAIRMGFAVSWTLPRILLSVAALTALLLRVDMLWIVLAGAGISVLIR